MKNRALSWTAEEDALLGKAELPLVAVALDRSVCAVQRRMRKLGIHPFAPAPDKASRLKASRRLDTAIAIASAVGMGQSLAATANKFAIDVRTAKRHLAYFMRIIRAGHRLGSAIPSHWEEAENTIPGLLNAAAFRLSAEIEHGSLRPWRDPLKVTNLATPYAASTHV